LSTPHRIALGLSILSFALAVGACGHSDPSAPPAVGGSGTVKMSSVDPNFDSGQDVFITGRGFRPAWLVASTGLPITWHNVSGSIQSVHFDNQGTDGADSGPIEPGGVFVYTPNAPLSIVYHSEFGRGAIGRVQVLLPVET
jgi:hypothetical protein